MPSPKKSAPAPDFFAGLKDRQSRLTRLTTGTTGDAQEQLSHLDIAHIAPNPEQPRKQLTPDEDAELADDIRQRGVLQPIIVRAKGESFEIVAGERRWRAAQAAGLSQIPAIVRVYNDQEAHAVSAIENLQRKDLDPHDEARYLLFLTNEYNFSQHDLAQMLHKSQQYVSTRLKLLEQLTVDSEENHKIPQNSNLNKKSQSTDSEELHNDQKIELLDKKSQSLWHYRPAAWQKIQGEVAAATSSVSKAKPDERESLRAQVAQLRHELDALERALNPDV